MNPAPSTFGAGSVRVAMMLGEVVHLGEVHREWGRAATLLDDAFALAESHRLNVGIPRWETAQTLAVCWRMREWIARETDRGADATEAADHARHFDEAADREFAEAVEKGLLPA